MRDPAFLFYPGDWQGGTATFTRLIKGCYIDVLIAQFNSGPLSLEEIKNVLSHDFEASWPTLQKKFKQEDGLFFNERLEFEKQKRRNYSKSRRENRSPKTQEVSFSDQYKSFSNPELGAPVSEPEIEKKLASMVDQFLIDLPNSSYLTDISSRIDVPVETLKAYIPEFKKKCETSYKNMSEFATHFKNSYLKKQEFAPLKDPNKIDMSFKRKHFRKND